MLCLIYCNVVFLYKSGHHQQAMIQLNLFQNCRHRWLVSRPMLPTGHLLMWQDISLKLALLSRQKDFGLRQVFLVCVNVLISDLRVNTLILLAFAITPYFIVKVLLLNMVNLVSCLCLFCLYWIKCFLKCTYFFQFWKCDCQFVC